MVWIRIYYPPPYTLSNLLARYLPKCLLMPYMITLNTVPADFPGFSALMSDLQHTSVQLLETFVSR